MTDTTRLSPGGAIGGCTTLCVPVMNFIMCLQTKTLRVPRVPRIIYIPFSGIYEQGSEGVPTSVPKSLAHNFILSALID